MSNGDNLAKPNLNTDDQTNFKIAYKVDDQMTKIVLFKNKQCRLYAKNYFFYLKTYSSITDRQLFANKSNMLLPVSSLN